MRQTFTKAERLSSKKDIDQLFAKGKSFKQYPFYVVYQEQQEIKDHAPVQVLITVRKKSIRKAVKRNLLKRRIREAYRLNKHELYSSLQSQNKHLKLALVYTSQKIEDYEHIEKKIQLIINRLTDNL